jgi:sugar transferase (PEP-CTERM/EpsH1 system associated)
MISHLARQHSVVVASLAFSEGELNQGAGLADYCDEVIAEVMPDRVRWLNACRALPTTIPSSVAFFRSRRLQQRIDAKCERSQFDVAIVHCAFVAQYVSETSARFRILDYGDMDSAKWLEYSLHRRFPLSVGYGIEARKLRDYERNIASRFHHCTVTTQGEKDEFESLATGRPCTVIPNGVDTTYFGDIQRIASNEPLIAFLGRMDYFPNIDGVCHFAEQVFPLVRRKVPGARFVIVGSDPSRRVRALASIEGVTVTGHVPDVRSYVQNAALTVAPLRIARGTQNKILESMAMGIPVVASPQAAKGIQADPGTHLLVAESPEKFAQHVIDLLLNATLRNELAERARRHLRDSHNWAASLGVLDSLLNAYRQTEGQEERLELTR